MAKYNVGDRVRVRDDLEPRERYGSNTFVIRMKPCLGKIVTIKEIVYGNEYLVHEDSSCCAWTDEMFVGIVNVDEEDVIDVIPIEETKKIGRAHV